MRGCSSNDTSTSGGSCNSCFCDCVCSSIGASISRSYVDGSISDGSSSSRLIMVVVVVL